MTDPAGHQSHAQICQGISKGSTVEPALFSSVSTSRRGFQGSLSFSAFHTRPPPEGPLICPRQAPPLHTLIPVAVLGSPSLPTLSENPSVFFLIQQSIFKVDSSLLSSLWCSLIRQLASTSPFSLCSRT